MFSLEGKVAVVTGGVGGIGQATVRRFAQAGAKVVIADVDAAAGKTVESQLQKIGPGGLFVEADVSKAEACRRVVSETVGAFGAVDVLFNNVGIQPTDSYHNVEDTPEETWDRILDSNLKDY